MESAKEYFEARWLAEKETTPQYQGDKEREYRIYLCGWEDGIKAFIKTETGKE